MKFDKLTHKYALSAFIASCSFIG